MYFYVATYVSKRHHSKKNEAAPERTTLTITIHYINFLAHLNDINGMEADYIALRKYIVLVYSI